MGRSRGFPAPVAVAVAGAVAVAVEGRRRWTVALALVAGVTLVPLTATAQEQAPSQAPAQAQPPAPQPAIQPPPDVPADAIAAAPQRFAGQVVSVTAAIESVHGSLVFQLDENRVGQGPGVWMLVKRPLPLEEDTVVTVTGVVRPGLTPSIAAEYELNLEIDPTLLARLRSRPVLLATSVRLPNGVELLAAGR